jgi:hypothetical protein
MLPETSVRVTCAVLLITCASAAFSGFEARARLAQLLIPAALLPFLAILFALIGNNPDFSALKPEVTQSFGFEKGIIAALPYFGGLEFALIAQSRLRDRDGAASALRVFIFIGIGFTALTAAAIACFGTNGIAALKYPVADLLGGAGAIGGSFFIISAFAATSACLFTAKYVLNTVILGSGKKKNICNLLLVLIAAYIAGLFVKDAAAAEKARDLASVSGIAVFFVLLPVTFIIIKQVKRRVKKA